MQLNRLRSRGKKAKEGLLIAVGVALFFFDAITKCCVWNKKIKKKTKKKN